MIQMTIAQFMQWLENPPCRRCGDKATWLDGNSGYCDECFPYYPELGLVKEEFLKKKKRSEKKERSGIANKRIP